MQRGWAAWSPGSEPRSEPPVEPEQTEGRTVHVDWATPTAPRLVMAWKAPAHDPTDPDLAALTLIEDLLLADKGVLPQRLVRETSMAYAVSGGRWELVDPSLFTVSITLRNAQDRPRAEAIVREAILTLQDVDPTALAKVADHRRYRFLSSLDEPKAVAEALGWHLRRHPDPEALVGFQQLLKATTPTDIARVAEATFVDARLTIGTLSPPTDPPPPDDSAPEEVAP